jgi:hypothetical protein
MEGRLLRKEGRKGKEGRKVIKEGGGGGGGGRKEGRKELLKV